MLYLLAIWIVCGIYNYGRSFAFWWRWMPSLQKGDREKECWERAIFAAVAGPIATPTILFQKHYGFKWRRDGQP